MKKKWLECVVLLLFIIALAHGIIQVRSARQTTKQQTIKQERQEIIVPDASQETTQTAQEVLNNQMAGVESTQAAETGTAAAETEPVTETETQETTQTADTKVDIPTTGTQDVQELTDAILRMASPAFFEGYPVDDSFLGWVAKQKGSGVLQQVSAQLKSGKQDPKLWYQLTKNSMHVLWLKYCMAYQYQSYSYADVIWKEAADPSAVRLDFAGDLCLDPDWYTMESVTGQIAERFSDNLLQELKSADFTMLNNEFTYTQEEQAQKGKAYCFRADPKAAQLLETFGADMVSLANNHVFDYGEQGFLDTLAALDTEKIPYSGAGKNSDEAAAPRYVVIGGWKVAIVSATEIERFYEFTQEAGESTPGVLKIQQEELLKNALKEAKKNSDFVIAYLHWGTEGKINYGSDQVKLAELCADAGADAIIGSHPHRLQGVEYVNGVPVAYSLGNFWFGNAKIYSGVAQIVIDDSGKLTMRMLPCLQNGTSTVLLTDEEQKKEYYHYLADVSKNVGIDADGTIHAYKDVTEPGESPYTYTSGRRYGQHYDDTDLNGQDIDIEGNLQ